jgi:glycerol-3-phosphate acyltransferase PlsX
MKIVVDAMGGDHAPAVVVEGAVLAAREFGVEIVLVGREDRAARAGPAQYEGLTIAVVHRQRSGEMDDHVNAVRAKRDNSMSVGLRLIKEGKADAFMSAGNSGAVMAAALFGVGRIRGIDRPALASIFPASKTPAILIDLGANTDPTPQNLAQFAMMGSIYAERVLGLNRPRVAIVSNGEEAEKGNERVKALSLAAGECLNFMGNVEGKDIQGAGR